MEVNKTSPFSLALKSINKEFQNIADNASKVAGFANEANEPSGSSLAEPLIEISKSERAVEANLAVIKKLNEIEDEVLNIIA